MSVDPMKSVREITVAMPNATRVFEKTKIDYCCGGDQLLGAACAKAGIDLLTLEKMLETSVAPASTQASLIIAALKTHTANFQSSSSHDDR